jgi:UPF0716 protein FxsA
VLAILVLAFVVLPLVELYVIIQVGQSIGVWNTIGVLILVSVVGAWLARREGGSVLVRIRRQLEAGVMPTNELIDGGLILAGGLLLLTPGFVTDVFGILLLFPPTRALARIPLKRRFRIVTIQHLNGPGFDGRRPDGPRDDPPVIDV